jgi:NADH dehydrogenase/NADH:ubiquinone oxidoreductase subunit G
MKVKIDGEFYEGYAGETLMELAKRNNIEIPHLCHKKGFEGLARCRLCMVEIKEGSRSRVVSSCVYPIKEGIEVIINSPRIINLRKNIVMLLLLRTPNNEYIKRLAEEYEVIAPDRYLNNKDIEDCILCGLCVKACEKIGTNAISMVNRGTTKKVSTPYDDSSMDCIGCGACAEVCPTEAIKILDKDGKRVIWNRTFELLKCSRCGKYYTTIEAFNYANKMLDNKDEEQLCNDCKRRAMGNKFKKAYQNIY